jgi:MIP family channel proteins
MSLWVRNAVAEAIGVFALCFIGILAIDAMQVGALTGVALAHGLAIAVMVAALGHVSGGHFNPAVTLGLLVGRRIDPIIAAVYWAAQLVGGLLAALAVAGLESRAVVAAGTPALSVGVGALEGILLEAVATFFLVLVVLGTAVDQRAPRSVYPFAIGLTITAGILAIGPQTGGALNPARGFGPALVGGEWSAWAAWLIGPLVGGVVAALVHDLVFAPQAAGEAVAEAGERREV